MPKSSFGDKNKKKKKSKRSQVQKIESEVEAGGDALLPNTRVTDADASESTEAVDRCSVIGLHNPRNNRMNEFFSSNFQKYEIGQCHMSSWAPYPTQDLKREKGQKFALIFSFFKLNK